MHQTLGFRPFLRHDVVITKDYLNVTFIYYKAFKNSAGVVFLMVYDERSIITG